jgi:hypothetical protein
MTDDPDLFADLSRRLRDAHRRVRAIDADDETRADVVRRLIAITNASKHDLSRASQRLDSLVADLDAGRYDDDGE